MASNINACDGLTQTLSEAGKPADSAAHAALAQKLSVKFIEARVHGLKFATKANMRRLIVRGNSDVSRSILGFGITPDYRETWIICEEPEGFIWREITHRCGANGHHPSLRALVEATVVSGLIRRTIEVLPEPLPSEIFEQVAAGVAADNARWGKKGGAS